MLSGLEFLFHWCFIRDSNISKWHTRKGHRASSHPCDKAANFFAPNKRKSLHRTQTFLIVGTKMATVWRKPRIIKWWSCMFYDSINWVFLVWTASSLFDSVNTLIRSHFDSTLGDTIRARSLLDRCEVFLLYMAFIFSSFCFSCFIHIEFWYIITRSSCQAFNTGKVLC